MKEMTRFNKPSDFKEKKIEKHVNQALFDTIKDSIPPEERERYKEMGEKMYNSIDFNTNQVLDQPENEIESVACLIEAIKSGLHPDYMSEDEIAILTKHYGEEWKCILSQKLGIEYI